MNKKKKQNERAVIATSNPAACNELVSCLSYLKIDNIKTTSRGKFILETLMQEKKCPDYLFVDINLADMNSLQLIQAIRKSRNFNSIKILITCRPEEFKAASSSLEHGIFGVIEKPFKTNKIISSIENQEAMYKNLGSNLPLHQAMFAANLEDLNKSYKKALHYIDIAIRIEKRADLLAKKANILMRAGEKEEAIDCFSLAIELDPKYQVEFAKFMQQTSLIEVKEPKNKEIPKDILSYLARKITEEKSNIGTKFSIPSNVLFVGGSSNEHVLIKPLLKNMGIKETKSVVDGSQCYQTLQESEFDLIISWLSLPDMNALQLVELIRRTNDKLLSNPLFFVILDEKHQVNLPKGYELGIDGHNILPLKIDTLSQRLNMMLAQKMLIPNTLDKHKLIKATFACFELNLYEKGVTYGEMAIEEEEAYSLSYLYLAMNQQMLGEKEICDKLKETSIQKSPEAEKEANKIMSFLNKKYLKGELKKYNEAQKIQEEEENRSAEEALNEQSTFPPPPQEEEQKPALENLDLTTEEQEQKPELEALDLISEEQEQKPELEALDLISEEQEQKPELEALDLISEEQEQKPELEALDLISEEQEQKPELEALDLISEEQEQKPELEALDLISEEQEQKPELEALDLISEKKDLAPEKQSTEFEQHYVKLKEQDTRTKEQDTEFEQHYIKLEEEPEKHKAAKHKKHVHKSSHKKKKGKHKKEKLEKPIEPVSKVSQLDVLKTKQKKIAKDDQIRSLGISEINLPQDKYTEQIIQIADASDALLDDNRGFKIKPDTIREWMPTDVFKKELKGDNNAKAETLSALFQKKDFSALHYKAKILSEQAGLVNSRILCIPEDERGSTLMEYLSQAGQIYSKKKKKKIPHTENANKQFENKMMQEGFLSSIYTNFENAIHDAQTSQSDFPEEIISHLEEIEKLKPLLLDLHEEYFESKKQYESIIPEVLKKQDSNNNREAVRLSLLHKQDNYSLESFKQIYHHLKKDNENETAKLFLKKQASIYANSPQARESVGKFLIAIEDYVEAEKHYEKILSDNKKDINTLKSLSLIAFRLEKYSKATKYCKAIIKQKTEYEYSYNLMAIMCKKQNKLRKAIKLYKEGLTHEPRSSKLFHNMAIAYAQLGDADQAKRAHRLAKNIDKLSPAS